MSAKSKNVLEILQTNISHRDYLTTRTTQSFPPPSPFKTLSIVSTETSIVPNPDLDSYANEYSLLAITNKNCWKIFRNGLWQFKKVSDCHTKELLKLTYFFTQERLGNKGLCDISWQLEARGKTWFPTHGLQFFGCFFKTVWGRCLAKG